MSGTPAKGKLGILVGGGPAPGINGVIHSATIEAINNGMEVVGIYDGFEHLMQGELVGKSLTILDVSRIHRDGGSILRTSPREPDQVQHCPGSMRGCARPRGDRLPAGHRRR